ncbi:MAG: protein-L-isoaspartate(D-aspartate) O-methyltransferase [Desulfomonilaceae bacterium]|nr:protein-L-isoaspartate(D-aspartate) O-methyltransferase [Desulfomonilaceae bacterium]
MKDYAAARKEMIEKQLKARHITDGRVLAAMEEVPRHLFVKPALQHEAYDDNPLPIGHCQTISQPYMVAVMTELLELRGHERVLEVGTGSGYQAAVLSRLCKWVYTIEALEALSVNAGKILRECGYDNISFKVGDGSRGWPEEAPFDAILVTAGAPDVPDTLLKQLVLGGNLVIPVGDRFSQTLKRVTKTESGTKVERHTGCRFVDLVGEFGWKKL